MKQLTEKDCRYVSNALGHDTWCCYQRFEVEESDVGVVRPHYGGHNYKTLTFTKRDVGKTIEVMTDRSAWTCWGFVA